jgi:hypothetical protein
VADEEITGAPWKDAELDLIVADYFAMLQADLAGQPYVKAQRNAALRELIGRSRSSVEYKHRNISAVLRKLGKEWLPGYAPAANYQNALVDAIDRQLSTHHGFTERPTPIYHPETIDAEVFVAAPALTVDPEKTTPRLNQLIRKFDPVERDRLNRALGRAGEEFVLEVEKRRLASAGLHRLVRDVRWIAEEEGDGAGYDILSFDSLGRQRLIEVKTTNGTATTPFFLSRNEHDTAAARAEDWRLYRVHRFSKEPRIFEIAPPLQDSLILQTESWRASFKA